MMKRQMELFQEGGLKDEGGMIDAESGNEVPIGSTREEVRDDIPAKLSEGEFVMPADVVRYHGLDKMMALRDEAKMGLRKMDAMGQMGNSDEATLPEEMPFGMSDLIVIAENGKEVEMAEGGYVTMANGGNASANTRQLGATYTPPKNLALNFKTVMGEGNISYKEYRNAEGKNILVAFIGGVPLYPIPEGYTEYVPGEDVPTTPIQELVEQAPTIPPADDNDNDQINRGYSLDDITNVSAGMLLEEEKRQNSIFGKMALGIASMVGGVFVGGTMALGVSQAQNKNLARMQDLINNNAVDPSLIPEVNAAIERTKKAQTLSFFPKVMEGVSFISDKIGIDLRSRFDPVLTATAKAVDEATGVSTTTPITDATRDRMRNENALIPPVADPRVPITDATRNRMRNENALIPPVADPRVPITDATRDRMRNENALIPPVIDSFANRFKFARLPSLYAPINETNKYLYSDDYIDADGGLTEEEKSRRDKVDYRNYKDQGPFDNPLGLSKDARYSRMYGDETLSLIPDATMFRTSPYRSSKEYFMENQMLPPKELFSTPDDQSSAVGGNNLTNAMMGGVNSVQPLAGNEMQLASNEATAKKLYAENLAGNEARRDMFGDIDTSRSLYGGSQQDLDLLKQSRIGNERQDISLRDTMGTGPYLDRDRRFNAQDQFEAGRRTGVPLGTDSIAYNAMQRPVEFSDGDAQRESQLGYQVPTGLNQTQALPVGTQILPNVGGTSGRLQDFRGGDPFKPLRGAGIGGSNMGTPDNVTDISTPATIEATGPTTSNYGTQNFNAFGEGVTPGLTVGERVPYTPSPIIARADERNFVEPDTRARAIETNARLNEAAEQGRLITQLERPPATDTQEFPELKSGLRVQEPEISPSLMFPPSTFETQEAMLGAEGNTGIRPDPRVPYSPSPIIARADEKNFVPSDTSTTASELERQRKFLANEARSIPRTKATVTDSELGSLAAPLGGVGDTGNPFAAQDEVSEDLISGETDLTKTTLKDTSPSKATKLLPFASDYKTVTPDKFNNLVPGQDLEPEFLRDAEGNPTTTRNPRAGMSFEYDINDPKSRTEANAKLNFWSKTGKARPVYILAGGRKVDADSAVAADDARNTASGYTGTGSGGIAIGKISGENGLSGVVKDPLSEGGKKAARANGRTVYKDSSGKAYTRSTFGGSKVEVKQNKDGSWSNKTNADGDPVKYSKGTGVTSGHGTAASQDNSTDKEESKIICTAMNASYGFGSYRQAIWLSYSNKHLTKEHEVGYHTLFLPLVHLAYTKDNKLIRKLLEHGTRRRTADIRAELKGTKRNTLGRIYRAVLEPLCYGVGKIKMTLGE